MSLITVAYLPNLITPGLTHTNNLYPIYARLRCIWYMSESKRHYLRDRKFIKRSDLEPIPFKEWVKTHKDYEAFIEEGGF